MDEAQKDNDLYDLVFFLSFFFPSKMLPALIPLKMGQ